VKEFMFHSFYVNYNNQNDIAKAYLCHQTIPDLRNNLNLELIEDLLKLVRKKDTSPMEELLITKGATVLDKKELETALLEMKGTYYMQHNQMKEAVEVFETCLSCKEVPFFSLPDYMNGTLFSSSKQEAMFGVPIKSQARMLYTNYPSLQKEMNKLELARNLMDLEMEAQKNPAKAGEVYFMLGSAWLNMSPIGWHRPVLYYDYDHFGTSRWEDGSKDADKLTADIHRKEREGWFWAFYYNPDIAFDYFEKAVNATSDRDLQAEILFQAARLEQYTYFKDNEISSWDSYYNYHSVKSRKGYNNNFTKLKAEYSDTKYYKEVINECWYLMDFAYTN